MPNDWLKELFIDEAKKALDARGNGLTGGSVIITENDAGGLTYDIRVGEGSSEDLNAVLSEQESLISELKDKLNNAGSAN